MNYVVGVAFGVGFLAGAIVAAALTYAALPRIVNTATTRAADSVLDTLGLPAQLRSQIATPLAREAERQTRIGLGRRV